MAGLIDSSVVIELERRGHPETAIDAVLPGEELALAAISVSELLVGVHRAVEPARREQRRAFVEAVARRFPILPFDIDAARVHARLLVDLAEAGQPIGANDLLIAATALAHGYEVVTHNLRHFERVPGLVVQQPRW